MINENLSNDDVKRLLNTDEIIYWIKSDSNNPAVYTIFVKRIGLTDRHIETLKGLNFYMGKLAYFKSFKTGVKPYDFEIDEIEKFRVQSPQV